MADGDIWLAGSSGDCSRAGECPDGGPCGDGENPGDCPDLWTDIATYKVSYGLYNGSPVFTIGGRNLSPGETIRFVRGSIDPRPYSYPVDVMRSGGVFEEINPPARDGVAITLAFDNTTLSIMTPWGGPYPFNANYWNGRYSYIGETTIYPFGGAATTVQEWRKIGRSIFKDASGTWYLNGSAPPYLYPPFSMAMTSASNTALSGEITPRPGPFYAIGASTYGGSVSFTGYVPGFTELPADIISWGVQSYPGGTYLYPKNPWESIPEAPNYDTVNMYWGTENFVDVLSIEYLTLGSGNGEITLKIRSACENPPP